MKLEVVTDASGLPLGMATDAANVSETELLKPALDDVPVAVPPGTPVIADRGHDSDPLRDKVEDDGFRTIIPHRKNRAKPSVRAFRLCKQSPADEDAVVHEEAVEIVDGPDPYPPAPSHPTMGPLNPHGPARRGGERPPLPLGAGRGEGWLPLPRLRGRGQGGGGLPHE